MRANFRFLLRSSLIRNQRIRKGQIVHFQFPLHLPFGLLPFLAAKLCGGRIVFTAHDPMPHKWLFPAPLNRIERWSLACMYRLSDRIIVHSTAGWETITRHFGVRGSNLETVAHGPFCVAGDKPEETAHSRCLDILLFGSLRENKGIHLAIEAVQNLIANGIPIRLKIAGDTPNAKEAAYWSSCERLLAKQPQGIEVKKRYIEDSEVPGLLASCHAVLLPYTSFFSDSGVAALALSNGKPIIATRSGGLGEMLHAAELGIEISEPTVGGVQKALLAAWNAGPDELNRLGRNGTDHLLGNCSWTAAAQKTAAVYRALLAE